MGVDLSQPEGQVPDLPEEERLDLTSMPAYAIDDDGSNDPDDAISFHNDTLWVHVADVAALVTHESELDALAAQRAANLYLPEGIVHMLPEAITSQLGLGLNEISPALSIGMHVNVDFEVDDIKIVTSFIRATRVSYSEANQQLDSLLPGVRAVTDKFREKRLANNAAEINLPEASVRVKDGKVNINLMDRLESRQLVTDAMLMAGEAVAKFCKNNEITIPFATQPAPENIENPVKMSEMFAYRRQFKASRLSLEADAHFGLGLECYTRCTSPLRRYPDLVVHQQLRAFLSHQAGEALLDRQTIEQKVMAVDQQSMTIRRTERLSNQHWKLVYLQQNPDWQGEAVVVNIDERKTTVIIPELAMETKIRTRDSFSLDDTITLRVSAVDLPEQSAFFHNLN
jgi:exoribonuclease-2